MTADPPFTRDDGALLDALRRGDADAFRAVFEQHADRLYRLSISMLRDADDAEDAVQETFIKLNGNLDRIEGRSSLGTWLYRVATNEALQRLRRPDRRSDRRPLDLESVHHRVADIRGADPALEAERAAQRQAIDAALLDLPETQRAAFLLRDIEGLSTAEAATALDVSESALKVRLHRARHAVRDAIAPDAMPPTTSAAGLSCQTALGWLDDYLDGSLATDDRGRLEAHVDGCLHCRIHVDTAHRTVELNGARRHWVIPAPRSSAMFDRLADVFSSRGGT